MFNYIIKGQGLGVKYILLASFIISLVFSIFIRVKGNDLVPYANDIINQMLPLKIENGVVVEPQNTIRVAHLQSGNVAIPLPIIMDTTIDTLDTSKAEKGFYLTRTAFYVINDNEVRMHTLDEDVDLVQDDYTDDIKSVLTGTAVTLFFIGILLIFITYFIATIFYALCAQILGLFFGKKYTFDTRMRLSVVCFLTVYILYFLLSLCGLESGKLIFFITTLILQSIVIYKLPAIQVENNVLANSEAYWPAEQPETKAEEKTETETEAEAKAEPEKKTTTKTVKKVAKAKAETTKKKAAVKKVPAKKKAPTAKASTKKKAEK